LLAIYQAALQAVNGEQVVVRHLAKHSLSGRWAVFAVGKAANAMAMGARQVLGQQVHSGLVIAPHGQSEPRLLAEGWTMLEGGHPLPDGSSLQAGETLLRWLDSLEEGVPLLVLLSGGASALIEALPAGITLDDLVKVNDWLLGSGLDIGQMNGIRKRLSRIKGGRLARYLRERRCLQLLISDVPGDDPATIGSAPLYPSASAPITADLPSWFAPLMQGAEPEVAADDPAFVNIETHVIASNAIALQAAAEMAQTLGMRVTLHPEHFQGQAAALAEKFVQSALQGAAGLQLWGGESTVILPPQPGNGGRSQQLALTAAKLLAGHDDILFLAAGTDGRDGPGEAVGALVDGSTRARGEEEGFSLDAALAAADSGSFLAASGDLIETGPTGTNVMDLVFVWKRGGD